MENAIQIFEHEEFGQIRILGDFDNPLFCLADLCRALGLPQVAKVVQRLDKEVLSTHPLETAGGIQQMYFVNEDGFYDVLLDSRKPIAKRLRKWVTSEILPSIRKYGYYSLATATKPAPVVRTPNPKRRAAQLADARVYIAKINNGTVKIGNSKDVDDRKSRLQTKYKLTVEKTHNSSLFSRKIARAIEKALHNIFSSFRVDGEFFNVEYEFACAVLDALEKFVISLPYVFDSERGDKLLAIADMMTDSVERQTLLTQTANLFVGKKFD